MAGHSKFKNIQYRKGAQDKKRAKVFSRLAKEITVAAKLGMAEPDANPRLRTAIAAARAQNMPKDNIERAIKRSQDADGANYEEVRYEGFAPAGIGIIVEALTDNRNRTAAAVRSIFSKYGGNMGETGAVSFMFSRMGAVRYPAEAASGEKIMEASIEAGADDCESSEEGHEIFCEAEKLHDVVVKLEAILGAPHEANIIWRPQNEVPLSADDAEKVIRLVESLDDIDDVQNLYANFDIPQEVMDKISQAE